MSSFTSTEEGGAANRFSHAPRGRGLGHGAEDPKFSVQARNLGPHLVSPARSRFVIGVCPGPYTGRPKVSPWTTLDERFAGSGEAMVCRDRDVPPLPVGAPFAIVESSNKLVPSDRYWVNLMGCLTPIIAAGGPRRFAFPIGYPACVERPDPFGETSAEVAFLLEALASAQKERASLLQRLDEAEKETQRDLVVELRVKKTDWEALASGERASILGEGEEVPRKLTPSERRLAEIARKNMTLAREIKAIRAYGAVPSYTKEDLKLWKNDHPEFLLFRLGLSDDEILGHVKARKTTPIWVAAKIVGRLETLDPDTVDDYSRRFRKLIRYL